MYDMDVNYDKKQTTNKKSQHQMTQNMTMKHNISM